MMRKFALTAACAAVFGANAATAADFYAGKTLTFIIGTGPGGGYDIYGRVAAKHLGKYIPGNPHVLVQNMEGASTVRAAGFIYKIAPKDGTSIAAISPGAVVGPLLEGKLNGLYDPTKFQYLATANNSTRVCAVFHTSTIKTFKDAYTQEAIISASAEGGSTRDYAYLHKKTSHVNFRIISGYHGTPSAMLAMERGETDGLCGIDWSSLRSQKADWVRDGKLRVLVQAGLEPSEELTKMGVPMIWDFFQNDTDRQVAELVIAQQLFGRPYIAPPETPADRVEILRKAFDLAMKDPDLLADAEKARIDILPAGGERVQQGVAKIYATPKEIVERAREAIRE